VGRRIRIGVLVLAGFAAFALFPAASLAHPGSHAPKHKFGRGTSTNWSGYAVNGTGATHVIGTWTQPTANCASRENSWSSPWVGIDGNTSNTVEQIGTDTDCSNGTPSYYAWYEMYPKSLVVIPITVTPRHSYTGEVTSTTPGTFVLKLTDNSTPAVAPFVIQQTSKKARATSVEWVMEGPSRGLLTDFGSVGFTGASGAFGAQSVTPSSSNAQQIIMVTQQGVPRAVPSDASGDSFSVGWQHG
jgi:peptidase A4-like protein